MKTDSGKPEKGEARICPVCGTKFYAADSGFCPVCILRGATGGESAVTGEPRSAPGSAGIAEDADGGSQVRRFEHYEVMLDEHGRSIELPGPSNLTLVTLEYRVKQKENGLKSRFEIK